MAIASSVNTRTKYKFIYTSNVQYSTGKVQNSSCTVLLIYCTLQIVAHARAAHLVVATLRWRRKSTEAATARYILACLFYLFVIVCTNNIAT